MSGGHLCEAKAPTEVGAETLDAPLFREKIILFVVNYGTRRFWVAIFVFSFYTSCKGKREGRPLPYKTSNITASRQTGRRGAAPYTFFIKFIKTKGVQISKEQKIKAMHICALLLFGALKMMYPLRVYRTRTTVCFANSTRLALHS